MHQAVHDVYVQGQPELDNLRVELPAGVESAEVGAGLEEEGEGVLVGGGAAVGEGAEVEAEGGELVGRVGGRGVGAEEGVEEEGGGRGGEGGEEAGGVG